MSAVAEDATPRLAPMYRMQFEPAQDCWVLLYPEGLVKLNLPATEILKRCDGKASVREITADLQRAFDQDDLRADVEDFLRHAYASHWLV